MSECVCPSCGSTHEPGSTWKAYTQRLESRPETSGQEISEALRNLAVAEATYRSTHDLEGDASPKTGRAWDLMRRAGDKARAALQAALSGKEG